MTITINETGLNTAVSEAGVTDTYSIVLDSQPTQNVIINIDGGTQLTTSPSQLIFTPQNWNVAQNVTVSAINDTRVEGNHTGTLQHTVVSNDPNYSNLSVNPINVAITDNDRSGLSVGGTIGVNVIIPNAVIVTQTDSSTNVTEGGATDTYSVVLNGQPTSDVTVTINSGSQLTTDKTQLIFNSANWNVPQIVAVTAVDDTVVEGNHAGTIQHTVTSSDTRFNNFPASSVNVSITDNDLVNPYSVIITQSGGNTAVTEGSSNDIYTVALASQPTANVTININSGTQLLSSTNRLVFTPDNWNVPRTVTVAAIDDPFVEGPHTGVINFTVTSSDTNFNSIPVDSINVAITDNDVLGVVINQSDGSTNVTEGGTTDTYTVILSSQPTSDVVVNLNNGTQLTTNTNQLVFTAQNWNIAQTVTVTAVDDSLIEATPHSGTIQHSVTSSDSRYNGITVNPVNVNITDNDLVLVTPSNGSTNVVEGGATDTYSIVLNQQPTSNVTININSGTQLTTNTNQLTFTPDNWNVAQIVTVTAVDDPVIEGNHIGIIQHTITTNDPNFSNTFVNPVNVNITDNDFPNPSVIITETNGSTIVTEGGINDSYTVVLGEQPTANVTININSSTQLLSSTNRLVFTPLNWNVPRTVTVAAVNDTVVEGPHTGLIQFTVTSPDVNYNNLPVNPITVTINDNDIGTPGVIITESNGNTAVAEGGATDSYSVVLSAPPTSNVVININSGTQLSTNSNQLTFTPQNWNVAQIVTVTAVDDAVVEGNHSGTIQHTVTSTDSRYNNITVNPVNVSITDNDFVPLARVSSSDVFNIASNNPTANLLVTLTNSSAYNGLNSENRSVGFSVDELGLFVVDDAQGRVNGLLPGDAGYTQAALDRAQVLLSGVPDFLNEIVSDRQQILQLDSGAYFRFYLVRNSSLDNVRQGTTPVSDVLFGTPSNPQINNSGTNVFSIAWEDGTSDGPQSNPNDFIDLVVTIENTNQPLTTGTGLQTKPQGEVLDLRGFTQPVQAEFFITREGRFDDYVGFYRVVDENGGIDTNGDGTADVNPGNANYIQTAINNRVAGIDLVVITNPDVPATAEYQGSFQPGAIYAPFIIANGRPEALLDANTSNDRPVYFPYLGANADNKDHMRLLGDNYFGFEDLPLGNTDFDQNDFTVKVNFV
ncbi:MAG TPA: DUF4114 domain-containing protein [Nostocaceae cyanobacterium]|nr:DUF4114 domain-containing protein [Nostocaceae cyanobacterium]